MSKVIFFKFVYWTKIFDGKVAFIPSSSTVIKPYSANDSSSLGARDPILGSPLFLEKQEYVQHINFCCKKVKATLHPKNHHSIAKITTSVLSGIMFNVDKRFLVKAVNQAYSGHILGVRLLYTGHTRGIRCSYPSISTCYLKNLYLMLPNTSGIFIYQQSEIIFLLICSDF